MELPVPAAADSNCVLDEVPDDMLLWSSLDGFGNLGAGRFWMVHSTRLRGGCYNVTYVLVIGDLNQLPVDAALCSFQMADLCLLFCIVARTC